MSPVGNLHRIRHEFCGISVQKAMAVLGLPERYMPRALVSYASRSVLYLYGTI